MPRDLAYYDDLQVRVIAALDYTPLPGSLEDLIDELLDAVTALSIERAERVEPTLLRANDLRLRLDAACPDAADRIDAVFEAITIPCAPMYERDQLEQERDTARRELAETRAQYGSLVELGETRASYRRLVKDAAALAGDASRAEAARNAALENAGVLARRVVELEGLLSLQTSVNTPLLGSPPLASPSTGLHPGQKVHLVGISEYAMHGLVLFGTDDDGFARAIHNAFLLGQYWAELTLSPRWVELRVWKLHAQEPKTMHGGQEVFLHPSMLKDGYAHSGPPDYVNREGYDVDRWAGTRLAAHGMLWMMADGKPAIDGAS